MAARCVLCFGTEEQTRPFDVTMICCRAQLHGDNCLLPWFKVSSRPKIPASITTFWPDRDAPRKINPQHRVKCPLCRAVQPFWTMVQLHGIDEELPVSDQVLAIQQPLVLDLESPPRSPASNTPFMDPVVLLSPLQLPTTSAPVSPEVSSAPAPTETSAASEPSTSASGSRERNRSRSPVQRSSLEVSDYNSYVVGLFGLAVPLQRKAVAIKYCHSLAILASFDLRIEPVDPSPAVLALLNAEKELFGANNTGGNVTRHYRHGDVRSFPRHIEQLMQAAGWDPVDLRVLDSDLMLSVNVDGEERFNGHSLMRCSTCGIVTNNANMLYEHLMDRCPAGNGEYLGKDV